MVQPCCLVAYGESVHVKTCEKPHERTVASCERWVGVAMLLFLDVFYDGISRVHKDIIQDERRGVISYLGRVYIIISHE